MNYKCYSLEKKKSLILIFVLFYENYGDKDILFLTKFLSEIFTVFIFWGWRKDSYNFLCSICMVISKQNLIKAQILN